MKSLLEQKTLTSAHGVYTGTAERKDGPIRIWPLRRFPRELHAGNVLG